ERLQVFACFNVVAQARRALEDEQGTDVACAHLIDGPDDFVDEVFVGGVADEAAHERVLAHQQQDAADLWLEEHDDRQHGHAAERTEQRTQDGHVHEVYEEPEQEERQDAQKDTHGDGAPHKQIEPVQQIGHEADLDEVNQPNRYDPVEKGQRFGDSEVLVSVAPNTRSSSTVGRTSWVRTSVAPRKTAADVAPSVPNSRSSTGNGLSASPRMVPMVLLREMPTSTGRLRPSSVSTSL